MISICTTIKNRSRVEVQGRELRLFPNCVRSIVDTVAGRLECELVVADFASDDLPLEKWLHEAADPIPVRIVTMPGSFSRGQGLNQAARAAKGDMLFFLDVDCLVCATVFERGLSCANAAKAYFPILYAFADPEHSTGSWLDVGYGHAIVSADLFYRSGGWPEYSRWGKEDDDFFAAMSRLTEVIRERVPSFYHQWHPDDIGFKDRYSARAPELKQELKQVDLSWRELAGIIPPLSPFILVDEARFGKAPPSLAQFLPFPEREGEYWGHPPDDATAVAEFERLRSKGATHIAFAWMAFWWLDYYLDLRHCLHDRFPVVLQNERLTVFDLRAPGANASEST